MKVKVLEIERPRITRQALVRRTTKVYSTTAKGNEAKHLHQVHTLPERVQQDLGEMKILAFR